MLDVLKHVLQDLLDFAPKVKDDGLIMGHDFFEDAFASERRYGVIGAVNRFLRRANDKEYRLICLTYEPFSSYVIAKENSEFADSFLKNLMESGIPLQRPALLAVRRPGKKNSQLCVVEPLIGQFHESFEIGRIVRGCNAHTGCDR